MKKLIRDDVCYLVSESPEAHGIFELPVETSRMVYCTVRSVGQQEFYRAAENRLHPTIVFVLQDAIEYNGEKIVLWTPRGGTQERYRVLRTYQDGAALELVCEEATIDAIPGTAPPDPPAPDPDPEPDPDGGDGGA